MYLVEAVLDFPSDTLDLALFLVSIAVWPFDFDVDRVFPERSAHEQVQLLKSAKESTEARVGRTSNHREVQSHIDHDRGTHDPVVTETHAWLPVGPGGVGGWKT